jgi:hypothetical protein
MGTLLLGVWGEPAMHHATDIPERARLNHDADLLVVSGVQRKASVAQPFVRR